MYIYIERGVFFSFSFYFLLLFDHYFNTDIGGYVYRFENSVNNNNNNNNNNRDETTNHIISKCSKFAQKYKTRHDWLEKVIHWEICKKFEFDHVNKWYTHNPTPVLEYDTHKLLWDFDIKTDRRIYVRNQTIKQSTKRGEFAKLWIRPSTE